MYLSCFFPSFFFPKLSQSQQWVSCRDLMEWLLASPRAPMTFPATSPATMTYCPCVTAQRTHPRHLPKAPALCSKGHTLRSALTACQHLGNLQLTFKQLSLHSSSNMFDSNSQMLRCGDSHGYSGCCLAHTHTFSWPRRSDGRKVCTTHQRPFNHFIFLWKWSLKLLPIFFVDLLKWNVMVPNRAKDSVHGLCGLTAILTLILCPAHNEGLLFKGSQVFIISPKQTIFFPQEGTYGNLDHVKAGDDLLHADTRLYDFSVCAAAAHHSTAGVKWFSWSALKQRQITGNTVQLRVNMIKHGKNKTIVISFPHSYSAMITQWQ